MGRGIVEESSLCSRYGWALANQGIEPSKGRIGERKSLYTMSRLRMGGSEKTINNSFIFVLTGV